MEKLGETGKAHAGGFIFSFLKGAQAEDRARAQKEAAAWGGSPARWAGGRVSASLLLPIGWEGGALGSIKMSIFYFCLKT